MLPSFPSSLPQQQNIKSDGFPTTSESTDKRTEEEGIGEETGSADINPGSSYDYDDNSVLRCFPGISPSGPMIMVKHIQYNDPPASTRGYLNN